MYDIIGDIHGHADCLVELLRQLGYERVDGTYAHPDGRPFSWATSLTAARKSTRS